jgi:uncharacterized protein YggE
MIGTSIAKIAVLRHVLAAQIRFDQPTVMKLFLLALLSLPPSLLANDGLPTRPYIYVEGKAEIEKPADIVTLRFNVVGRAADQPKANQDVQAKANKVFELLKSGRIAHTDVIAENLTSEPQFEQEETYPKRGKIIGYTVTRPFQVKVHDVTSFPKLVDELVAIGGIEFSGIDGGLANEKETQSQMWEKALANAREKAEKTLKPMGMKIDSIFAVSPVSFPEIQGRIFGSGATAGGAAEVERVIEPSPLQYRLAPITVSQSVHVIYLISPAK